ncbi:MAG: M42 family metallopeptidase [Oscillospiraceae bacterium]|nr:M42 family metallopeptidase [Oscillospiraceae bacterium]
MELNRSYAEFAAEKAIEVLKIDSPSGFTRRVSQWVAQEFAALGCRTIITNKGAVLVDFGPDYRDGDALLLEAHADTLGAIVAEVKGNGRLRLSNIGGLTAANTETENVRIYARDGRVYEGTIQLMNPSLHVNREFSSTERSWNTVEVVIDEPVNSAEDVKKLGINVGDFVCPDPRAHITPSGYIKSRYLDDKLSVGILLGFAKYLQDNAITLPRRTYALITVYEEVGHGGSTSIPAGVTEAISVDMGCVGEGLQCTEHQVSICAKDSGGPYDYDVTDRLVKAAIREGADYAIDIYPFYGSDVEATLTAGYDVRHGLIGAGVFASHGYERSHIDGVWSALKVLKGYLDV